MSESFLCPRLRIGKKLALYPRIGSESAQEPTPVNKVRSISQIILLAATLLAALPLYSVVRDWMEIAEFEGGATTLLKPSARGSDWVVWEDTDGSIAAAYVFPSGPGYRAGIRAGDEFYALEYAQYFDAEDLSSTIAGIKPGQTRDFILVREGKPIDVSVTFERHPTFLYPSSGSVWQFALFAFTIGAFFHVLGLIIATPLALHNRGSRADLIMIGVSALWIVGNTARLLLVEMFGPAATGSFYAGAFEFLTILGLAGWIGFPVLLVRKLSLDADLKRGKLGSLLFLVYLVPAILAGGVFVAAWKSHLGPFTLEDLLVPILFYASCYIGAASGVSFFLNCTESGDEEEAEFSVRQWGLWESLLITLVAIAVALSVLDIIPVFSAMSESGAAWVIVAAQLLAVVPVTLYTIGTLRYGKVDEVLNRAIVYVLVIGLIFFSFVGGLTLMDSLLVDAGRSRIVLEGIFVVILLVIFERISRRLRVLASSIFATERHRGRQVINRYQEEASEILDADSLAQRSIEVAGKVFDARSAIIFLRSPADGEWIIKRYRPEPPYFTEQVFESIWPYFETAPTIWARNPELNAHTVTETEKRVFLKYGSALAVPIRGDEKSVGMIILGVKARRRSVYNLEDLDQLRSLAGNLALAVDRLSLVEREKSLAAESSEAHLVALRSQINPHFLFNALNTLLALIEEKPTEAEAVVEHLAAIFRYTLQTGSRAFVSMEEEMSLVEHYLKIEKARFEDRIQLTCLLDEDLKSHQVPAFAIQTLVENAIKHGLEKRRGQGSLTIEVSPESDSTAKVVVTDTGVGIPTLFGKGRRTVERGEFFGIGLSNVFDRLHQLFGRDDLLAFESDPDEGTTVTMVVPAERTFNS